MQVNITLVWQKHFLFLSLQNLSQTSLSWWHASFTKRYQKRHDISKAVYMEVTTPARLYCKVVHPLTYKTSIHTKGIKKIIICFNKNKYWNVGHFASSVMPTVFSLVRVLLQLTDSLCDVNLVRTIWCCLHTLSMCSPIYFINFFRGPQITSSVWTSDLNAQNTECTSRTHLSTFRVNRVYLYRLALSIMH